MSYLKRHGTRDGPEQVPVAGTRQVPDSTGARAPAGDDWTRLRRFLVLGSERGTYDARETALTREGAPAVERCLDADGLRAVAEVVTVSEAGRAPRNDPALFALAIAASLGDPDTRRAALEALPRVARTGTHLLRFATFVEALRGWGPSLRRAVGRWYAAQPVDALAQQALTDRARDGRTHRDLLRVARPARTVPGGTATPEHARLFDWIANGGSADDLPRVVEGFARAQGAATPAATARLVGEYRLPREAVKPGHLGSPEVWAALLPDMPVAALVRSLATLARVGVLTPGADATELVTDRLGDADRLRASRMHPIALLAALRTYAYGRGTRGAGAWEPVPAVLDALDAAFYAAFANVQPSGGRVLLAIDVSGSMARGAVAGVPGLSARDASAAMALVTAATECRPEIVAFSARSWFHTAGRRRHRDHPDGLTRLHISPGRRLGDAVRAVTDLPFGGTDCALPMLYAQALEREIDTFVILTDHETSAGDVHPVQALRDYRRASGIDARLVVVGMVSNGFSIADPADDGMLDVVGFDTATPHLISDVARRAL